VAENKTVKSPCPSLVFKDGRYWCEEVLKADNPRIKEILAIGGGCSSSMFNTDRERMKRRLNGI
jgi:hypothetical protein